MRRGRFGLFSVGALFNRPRRGRPAGGARLAVPESLETRAMLSATVDDDGLLTIVGTARRDVIEVRPGVEPGIVSLRGVDGVARDTMFAGVKRVSISTLEGHDKITIASGVRDVTGALMAFRIDSGAGNDVVDGGDGKDEILAGLGNDSVRGRGGDDSIDLGGGNDVGSGGTGDDRIVGGQGFDRIFGEAGNDDLDGGSEGDVVRGGDGDDAMKGGVGDDALFGGSGNDVGDGEAGRDQILGEAGNDKLAGGIGRDVLRGGMGDDSLDGGDDADDLWGEQGDDSINGGRGRDRIRGGVGSNACIDDDGDNDLDRRGSALELVFVGSTTTVTGVSASKDDKRFFTFRAPEGATTLSVLLAKGDTGDFADLEIESFADDVTLVELEPSETGVNTASGLAIVAGRAYKLRLRAPDRTPAGFTVTLTVA
ncbi:MAG: calcium-binding protein [Planctomycetaceae bacterium]